ncbi:MAG: deoxyribonuclease [Solirubrobacteraceae bacterium]|nr:deoxyribonuclease [Solirubrobacteraceae bacterium]
MLIGAHVSPSGGLYKAVERGVERGCRAIQIFNQSPRAWRPTSYSPEDFAAFNEKREGSGIDGVLIHAVYLLNCASEDDEIRAKSLRSLTHSLRIGDAIGADAVVLHPGSALKGNDPGPAIPRAAKVFLEALAETERCPLHLENTAGGGGTLGRSFDELAQLVDAAHGHERIGICLDSCHLFAMGHDVRDPETLAAVIDECAEKVGLERLGSLHYNDSRDPLGSMRDRHASVGAGELGEEGCAVFLSEPRFDGLPCVLETPGPDKHGPDAAEIARAVALRDRGRRARAAS